MPTRSLPDSLFTGMNSLAPRYYIIFWVMMVVATGSNMSSGDGENSRCVLVLPLGRKLKSGTRIMSDEGTE